MTTCFGTIRHHSATEINVRSGPGTNHAVVFRAAVGTTDLTVREVQVDNEGKHLNNKLYQWFYVAFPDGREGWVRDDLIDIRGECTAVGYDVYSEPKYAVELSRRQVAVKTSAQTGEVHTTPTASTETTRPQAAAQTVAPAATKTSSQTGEAQPQAAASASATVATPASALDIDRVRKAAFAVTETFEGGGFAAYQNHDSGIISYGIIQFTLSSGNLFVVVDRYLQSASSATAGELRNYYERIRNRDESLRHDENLKRILIAAAHEPEMHQAQISRMTENYWDRLINDYIKPRNYKYPLTYALLFDIAVNFGVGDGFVRMAEKEFGVPAGSNPDVSGVSEEKIITRVAELRKISHDKQAARDGLPGLAARGNFWMKVVNQGDWNFLGDAEGNVEVLNRKVQIANP